MSRNAITTPEGPGQGRTDVSSQSPNAINDVISHNQFIQYPVYPPIYPYPLTSLLTLPPSTIPPPQQQPQQPQPTQPTVNNNNLSSSTSSRQNKPNKSNSHKSSNKKRHHHRHHHHHHKPSKHHHTNSSLSSSNAANLNKKSIPKSKPKTVDLTRKNSRGELETLVRWIGVDSIQIKHHCSQDAEHNEWHCVCTVPLPFTINDKTQSMDKDLILKTQSNHGKKKDAIKIASNLMIQEILKHPLPISIDVINKDGQITSIPAKLSKKQIIKSCNNNNNNHHHDQQVNVHENESQNDRNNETPPTSQQFIHPSQEPSHHVSSTNITSKTSAQRTAKRDMQHQQQSPKNTPFGDENDENTETPNPDHVQHKNNKRKPLWKSHHVHNNNRSSPPRTTYQQHGHGHAHPPHPAHPPPASYTTYPSQPPLPPYDYDPYGGPPPSYHAYYRDWYRHHQPPPPPPYSRTHVPPYHIYSNYAPYYNPSGPPTHTIVEAGGYHRDHTQYPPQQPPNDGVAGAHDRYYSHHRPPQQQQQEQRQQGQRTGVTSSEPHHTNSFRGNPTHKIPKRDTPSHPVNNKVDVDNHNNDQQSVINGDIADLKDADNGSRSEENHGFLFQNENEQETDHDTVSLYNNNDHETDHGPTNIVVNATEMVQQSHDTEVNNNLNMVSEQNPSMFDEEEDEYMNELKEEEIPPNEQNVNFAVHSKQSDNNVLMESNEDKQRMIPSAQIHDNIQSKPQEMVRALTNPNPIENGHEDDMKLNMKSMIIHNNGEEKEMEGGFAVPPQRLLVLVPSQIEFKTIQSILPSNSRNFAFSKKLEISGLVCPAFTHPPNSEQESMADHEAPGEQNRLFIVQCGTGLVNVSLSIASVVQTVSIDAILLLGSAISLQPKSIKPGHLLLPNTVIQHDICLNGKNNAIFQINCKLSQWLRTLIQRGSGKENESLPVLYRGTLLSGSEIVSSETRIAYLASLLNPTPNNNGDAEEEHEDGGQGQEQQVEAENHHHYEQQEEDEEAQSVEKDGDIVDDGGVLYDDAMAVDRESAAVAIICRQLRIPFVVLKSIAPPRVRSNNDDMNHGSNYKDLYEDDDVTFDCTSSIPLIKALLKEYTEQTVFNY